MSDEPTRIIRGRATCFDDLVVSIRREIQCHETGKLLETCVVSGELHRLLVDLPCTLGLRAGSKDKNQDFLSQRFHCQPCFIRRATMDNF